MQRAALVAVVGAACVLCQRGADRIRFQHHTIASGPVTVATSPGYGAAVLADFDKDGDLDFAVLEREGNLVWTVITRDVLNDADDIHGGIAPRGVTDLDGDSDPDVALTDRWLANLARRR